MANQISTPQLSAKEIKALQAEFARVKAENEALKANGAKVPKDMHKLGDGISCTITAKGGLSVYGLGRFPVTLYKGQWFKILAVVAPLRAFIEANGSKLNDSKPADESAE